MCCSSFFRWLASVIWAGDVDDKQLPGFAMSKVV